MTFDANPPGGPAPADPTRGDSRLMMGLVLILGAAASLSPIRSYDYWWHLATGSLILDQRAVPASDPFSFTAGGTPWVDHEWLFQVLAYLGHRVVGPGGLVLLKVLLTILLCLLLASRLRRVGHGPAGTAAILTPVLLGAAFRLDVRPELATLALLPLTLHLVLRARDDDTVGPLMWVPPIVALWSNLHVGVVVAPAILGLGLAGTLAANALARRDSAAAAQARGRFARRLAIATAAAALSVGLNPYGLRLYAVPFELSRLLAALPWPNLEWARPALADFPLFWISLGASALLALAGWRRVDPIATPAMFLFGILAAAHLRNIALFFLLVPYGLGGPVRALVEGAQRLRLWRRAAFGGLVRPGFIAAAVLLAAAVPLLVLLPPGTAFGIGIASRNEPAAAVDFLEREQVGERMFNDVLFGGYLVWRRHPAARVFIDGRNEIYGDLLRQIDAGMRTPEAWEGFLERHRLDAAFLRYPPTLQRVWYGGEEEGEGAAGLRALSAAYFHGDDWALVYWDDDAMIFLRRLPRYENVIGRLEYRAIHPDDWRHMYAGVLRRQIPVGPILAELERKLAEDPGCRRALMLQGFFAKLAGAIGEEDAGAGAGGG